MSWCFPPAPAIRRLGSSRDLLVVGAYPATGSYDEPKPADVPHAKAVAAIARVRAPAQDPVYGKQGPLVQLWRCLAGADATIRMRRSLRSSISSALRDP